MAVQRARGFTLIEIIFVVFIIGLAVGVIGVSVGGDDLSERSKKEVETFMLQADYVAEQSILKGETNGLFIDLQASQSVDAEEQWCYQWRRVRDSQWQDLPELGRRCIAPELALEIYVNEELWEYDPELEFQEPVFGFFPAGDASAMVEITIFANQFQPLAGEEPQRLELDINGELRWINELKRREAEQRGR